MKDRTSRPHARYKISAYFDVSKSLYHIGRHLKLHTASFTRERTKLHQDIINTIMPRTAMVQRERPKAYVVIGGAGSGKSRVTDQLKHLGEFVSIDSDVIKEKLADHEHSQDPSIPRSQWLGLLQREATLLRQEMLFQAIHAKKDLIHESVGSDQSAIQGSIDALVAAGYEVELHLVDTSEAVAIDRVSERNKQAERQVPLSYAKKSNRSAKVTYQELARRNHSTIKAHRWSNDANEPQLDDVNEVNHYFGWCARTMDANRKVFLDKMNDRDKNQPHIKAHLDQLELLREMGSRNRDSHEMLMAMISDIAIFPELYFGHEKELHSLYRLIDKNDFHVYFTSMQMTGLMKSHGGLMIGSPKLEKGISLAAAGDPRRGQLQLPRAFKLRLVDAILALDKIPEVISKPFGSKVEIVHILQSGGSFDSYALQELISNCAPNLLKEYTDGIQFKPKWSLGFELWDKPRSSLQNNDTGSFNKQFPTYLKESRDSAFARGWGHLHHWFTRSTAIREQRHVASSTVLKRWITLANLRTKLDAERSLGYSKTKAFWHYDATNLSNHGGNCNTVSTHLLGISAQTASLFNMGTSKGLQMNVPKIIFQTPRQGLSSREPKSGNQFSYMLCEAHLAKLIVHHPQPYHYAIQRVNETIIGCLQKLPNSKQAQLIIEISNKFAEFNHEIDDPIHFLTQKLRSASPKDIYRSVMFHKIFFEEILSKSVSETARDRYEFLKMRPKSMFGPETRGVKKDNPPLDFHQGVGLMRLHQVGDLHVNQDSFNADLPDAPASSTSTFLDAELRFGGVHQQKPTFKDQVIEDDALFATGASGTVTTILPYVFNTILVDDPQAQEDYIMALAGALSYAGHHTMFEVVSPLKYMRSNCPTRFKDMSNSSEDLYDKVFTERFKRFIYKEQNGKPSPYQSSMMDFKADLSTMEQALQKKDICAVPSAPVDDLGIKKKSLLDLIDKKLINLHQDQKADKYMVLKKIKENLRTLDLNNLEAVQDLLGFITQVSSTNKINQFQGLTSFSRFKAANGQRVTESQHIIEQVHIFLKLVQKTNPDLLELEPILNP